MNYAILLSGGTGTRTGEKIPKQYKRVNGHMMISYALGTLLKNTNVDAVVLVADETCREDIMKEAEAFGSGAGKITGFADPGDTRQLSIYNALCYIDKLPENGKSKTDDTVLIHDAARPYVTDSLISVCYDALDGYDGVMPVLPMKDTVYQSEDGKTVTGLLERKNVYAGQAPELFLFGKYLKAVRKLLPDEIYKINGASEPAILSGMKILMIPGDEKNSKVTTGEDMKKFENGI